MDFCAIFPISSQPQAAKRFARRQNYLFLFPKIFPRPNFQPLKTPPHCPHLAICELCALQEMYVRYVTTTATPAPPDPSANFQPNSSSIRNANHLTHDLENEFKSI
jgi:hypothetical protein